jgi:hypothetical protein
MQKAKQMSGRKKNEANPVSGGKMMLIYKVRLYPTDLCVWRLCGDEAWRAISRPRLYDVM